MKTRKHRAGLFGGLVAFPVIGLMVLGIIAGAADAIAQPPLKPVTPGGPAAPERNPYELRYRRFYIAKEKLTELADKKYVPVKLSEFEDWLKIANSKQQAATVHIARAESVAEFRDGQLVNAKTRLSITLTGDATTVVALEPCRLAVTKASWKHGDAEAPAVLGMNAAGRTVVLVEQSGELTLDWSARGKRANGQVSFELALPATPISSLDLDLPAGLVPVTDSGLVTRIPIEGGTVPDGPSDSDDESSSRETSDDSAKAASERQVAGQGPANDPHASGSLSRWRIEPRGSSPLDLNVVPQESDASSPQVLLGPVADKYDFTASGIELTTALPLAVHPEPIESVTLRLDAELQLTAIKINDRDLTWAELPSRNARYRRFRVRFPFEVSGSDLFVGAMAPLVTGRPWRLPTIRVEEGLWREGEAELRFATSLVLQRLDTIGCRELAPPKKEAESWVVKQIRYYDPDATIDATLGHFATILSSERGTTIRPAPGTTAAEIAMVVSSESGEQFNLAGDVAESWFVESVETQPADALEDWEVTAASDQGRGPHQQLRIRLAKAVTPTRPVRILVHCSKTAPAGVPAVNGSELPLVDFASVKTSRDILCLRVGTSHEVQVESDPTVRRMDTKALTTADHALVQLQPNDLLLTCEESFRSLRVELRQEPARFSAEMAIETRMHPNAIVESYRIQCMPQTIPLRTVTVQLSESNPELVDWTLAGDGGVSSARRLPEPALADGGRQGETWELILERAHSQPFELTGTRRYPLRAEHTVALASLPYAESQTGTLEVRSLTDDELVIEAGALKSIPAPPLREDEQPVLRGKFRYKPGTDARLRILRRPARAESPAARVWMRQVISRFSANGEGIHDLYFRIENLGRSHVVLELPAAAALQTIRVEEKELATATATVSGTVTIPLPDGVRYPTVHLLYTTTVGKLGVFAAVDHCAPTIDLPVLQQGWSVSLPPGYEVRPGNSPSGAGDSEFSWQRRLFGALGRASRDVPARLPAISDWRSNDPPGSPAYELQRRDPLRALDRLGALLPLRPGGQETWGTLLQAYQPPTTADPTAAAEIPRLIVDAPALAHCGVISATPIPRVSADDARRTASRLLERFGLVLRSEPGFVLLTSIESLPALRRPRDFPVVGRGYGEPGFSGPRKLATHYLSVNDWAADASKQLPWSVSYRLSQSPAGGGWAFYDATGSLADGGRVEIYRRREVDALAWAAFVAAVGFVLAWSVRSTTRWMSTAATAAVLALLAPPVYVPVTAALFLGVVAGGALALLHLQRATAGTLLEPSSRPEPSSVVRTGLYALSLIISGAIAASTWAEEGATVHSAPTDPVYEVLIIGDEQNPGEHCYLPEKFHDALKYQAAVANAVPQGWLIRRAQYHCKLDSVAGDRLELGDFEVTYTIECLQPQQRVRLPLSRDRLQLLDAYLDHRPVQVVWSADGLALEFTVAAPGTSEIFLNLRPLVSSGENLASFEMGIPPVARSELRVEVPEDPSRVEIPSAIGTVVMDEDESGLNAQLGPADRLIVRWPQNPTPHAAESHVEVRQWTWLRIRPGSVLVDAKFHFTVHSGNVDQVSLMAAAGLRRLRPDASSQVFEVVRPQQPDLKEVRIPVPDPGANEFTIRVTFLMTNTSGVGKLVLPALRAATGVTTRRLLAVSVSEELESRPDVSPSLASVMPAEFLAEWDESEDKRPPDLALRVPAAEFNWGLSTLLREPTTTVNQQLDVSLGLTRWDVEYLANVETTGGSVLQHRLHVPQELQIRGVELSSEALRRSVTWARNPTGDLTLFFDRPQSGRHSLLIRGMLVPAPGQRAALPWLVMEGTELRSSVARVYRRPDADVQISEETGVERMPGEPVGAHREGFGRLVAAFREVSPGESQPPQVHIAATPNQPQVSGQLLTILERESGVWTAKVSCRLSVRGGRLDLVRLEIPAAWTSPIAEADDRFAVNFQAIPGRSRQLLIVRPALAIQDRIEFEIRGDVSANLGQHNLLPEVTLLDVEPLERFVALPFDSLNRPADWELSNLMRVAPPAPIDLDPGFELYHASERSRAVTRGVENSGTPHIHLADIHVVRDAEHRVYGVASYDLDPAGQKSAALQIPGGYRLFNVSVDGSLASITASGDGTFQIPLGASQLPRRVEVFFDGHLRATPGQILKLVAPAWIGIKTEATLWTLYGPESVASSGGERVSRREQDLIRLHSAARIIEATSDAIAEGPVAERESWYRAWLPRYTLRASALRSALPERDPLHAELATIEARQAEIATQLKALDLFNSVTAQPGVTNVHSFIMERLHGGREPLRLAFEGARQEIETAGPTSHLPVPPGLSYAVLAVVFGLGLFCVLPARKRWTECVIQYPYTVVVLLGLVWWLWMVPSWAGWLIMAAGVCGALRPSWKAHPRRRDDRWKPRSTATGGTSLPANRFS